MQANSYSLRQLGPLCEAHFGKPTYLAIYLLSGLGCSIASYFCTPNPALGASGAIAGLLGAHWVLLEHRQQLHGTRALASMRRMYMQLIATNAVLGLSMSNVDNWGHLGGLVAGATCAWVREGWLASRVKHLPPEPAPVQPPRQRRRWWRLWQI